MFALKLGTLMDVLSPPYLSLKICNIVTRMVSQQDDITAGIANSNVDCMSVRNLNHKGLNEIVSGVGNQGKHEMDTHRTLLGTMQTHRLSSWCNSSSMRGLFSTLLVGGRAPEA